MKNIRKKIITDRKAVALAYDQNDEAPKVIATGKNLLADKIINKAKEEKIPIHKDENLTESLSLLEIGAHIPQELYEIVAEILIFVDSMDNIKSKIV